MRDRLEAATRTLLRSFRSQRPLRGGSLLVTIIGDAIAPRGGAITLGSLIRLAAPFGLTERLVRTSVARLAHDDWLVARRNGRLSEYRLSAHGRRRFTEATRRIYGENPRDWSGRWTLVLLAPKVNGRARERLREELDWLGFGEPSPGVFAHPTRTPADTRGQLASLSAVAHATVLEAQNGDPEADRRFAAAGWDLGELAKRYRRFVRLFEPIRSALVAGDEPDPRTAFVIRTLLIHEYRKIHLRDPLLPAQLLPRDWIGAEAYELCREAYARVFAPAETHLAAMAERIDAPLPPPSAETLRRFGGISLPSSAGDSPVPAGSGSRGDRP
ncbi:MAG TPA: phenylacetic acid degradation operon negative regulatory protein PaaX [Steroidobacteraceae bacterium]|nr:phenylacetic acid degradation operon negative regulatory protein PaaX [Steroidobacteraceae bacterium]